MDLRADLIEKGYTFRTNHSDTEVLIFMYIEYQERMLKYLNGMYAFVIYDKKENILFGARDCTGIKPLYFSNFNGEFYFSSELKVFNELNVKLCIDQQSLSNYLAFQFIPSPKTIFENISKLEPAHYFIYNINNSKLTKNKYWHLFSSQQGYNYNNWHELILQQLEKSIKTWSLSDVELGVSLSGGIDSSTLVALASKNSDKNIKTFSLGFDGDISYLDERNLARIVSKKYNTNHFEYILNEHDLLGEIDSMIYHLDEPYAGGLPSWFIYKMMKGNVKVSLTGTGGDELFGNYNKSAIYNTRGLKKIRKFLSIGKRDIFGAIRDYYKYPNGFFYHKYFTGSEIGTLLIGKNEIQPEALIEDLISDTKESDFRNIVPYIDFKMQLPEEFLHVTDRFSMAHSIEARTPFLDPNLIELVMTIPPNKRMRFNDPKYLLKKSVENILPRELLNAPKKGFVVPQAKWIRTVLREKVEYFLGEEYLKKQKIFNPILYKKYVVPHLKEKKNYHWQIWTILMFQLWYDGSVDNMIEKN